MHHGKVSYISMPSIFDLEFYFMNQVKQTWAGGLIASSHQKMLGAQKDDIKGQPRIKSTSLGEMLPLCSKDLQLKIINMYSEVLCDPIVKCEC